MGNDTRAWEILDAVVRLNIETGRPVSSGLVERLLRKAYSSATIRAIMKRLEHDGYLKQEDGLFKFVSLLIRDWWYARHSFGYIPIARR